MAIKRNAVPILGKSLSPALMKRILTAQSEDIYVALDEDALKDALQIAENLLNLGKRVFLVDLKRKDPSEMGFKEFTQLIQTAKQLDLTGLMTHKLN